MNQAHPNNTLSNLSVEDQQRLLDWRSSHILEEVLQLAAQPRPEGLGLKTSMATLSRFFTNTSHDDLLAVRLETLALAATLARAGGGGGGDGASGNGNGGDSDQDQVHQALLQTLQEKTLRELVNPDQTLASQSRLASNIIRLAALKQQARKAAQRDQDLELQRQARQLAAQRFTFQSVHLLRQQFPFPDQIDLNAESKDIHTISQLLQSVLTGGNSLSAGGEGQGEVVPSSHAPVAVDVSPRQTSTCRELPTADVLNDSQSSQAA